MGPAVRACLQVGTPITPDPVDALAWETELGEVIANKLSPLALELMDGAGEALRFPAGERIYHDARRLAALMLALEQRAAEPLSALNEAGIRFVVIKGPAAARWHSQPKLRPYRDLDIVVHPSDFRHTVETLRRCSFGQDPSQLQPWQWFYRLCLEGMNVGDDRGGALDVHHHIAPWCFGTALTASGLWERGDPATVGSVPVRMASQLDSLVIAGLHVLNDLGKRDPSLLSWRDLLIISNAVGTVATNDAFRMFGLGWLWPLLVERMHAVVGARPHEGISSIKSSRSLWHASRRVRLRMMGWDRPSLGSRHPADWAFRLPLWRASFFLAGSAVPSPHYARHRHGGYLRYWGQAYRSGLRAIKGYDFTAPAPPDDAGSRRHRRGSIQRSEL